MTSSLLRRLPPLVLLLALAACGGDAPTQAGPGEQPATISPQARAYLGDALNLMQANSINRKKLDWPALRARAAERAGAAQRPAETYPAIIAALGELGDRHSFFAPPPVGASLILADGEPPTGQTLGRLAYVSMPGFSGRLTIEHATAYHDLLRALDTDETCGWILDLRGNPGGNMWPMLAGIGPVLGKGEPGAFVDPDGERVPWYYELGASGYTTGGNRLRVVQVSGEPYVLGAPAPPVAVLTGPGTASSGEAIVVAFRGRPETRSFGLPTYGVPTSNQSFKLSDQASIYLTVAWDQDRAGTVYDAPIAPDQRVEGAPGEPADPAQDPVVAAASAWLLERPACAS